MHARKYDFNMQKFQVWLAKVTSIVKFQCQIARVFLFRCCLVDRSHVIQLTFLARKTRPTIGLRSFPTSNCSGVIEIPICRGPGTIVFFQRTINVQVWRVIFLEKRRWEVLKHHDFGWWAYVNVARRDPKAIMWMEMSASSARTTRIWCTLWGNVLALWIWRKTWRPLPQD